MTASERYLAADAEVEPRLDLIRRLFLIGIVTSSFDVLLAKNVGGFTLRAHQILMVVPLAYTIGHAFSSTKIRLPIGSAALYAWIIFIVAFVPNTAYLLRSVGYAVWLLLDVSLILIAAQLFSDERWLKILIRWYLYGFIVQSGIGLLQLLLGIAHLPVPFARQLLFSSIPRL